MTRTEKMGISQTRHPYEATNAFGGAAVHVQRARYTAGKLGHAHELAKLQQGALSVLGKGFVTATLWRLFALILLLTLTFKRTVLVLLK